MISSPVRVALLIPDLKGGGAERVVVNLANGFASRGLRTDVVVMSAVGVFVSALSPQTRLVDLGVSSMPRLLPPLVRYLRRERPAALVAHMWPLTILAPLAKRLARVATRIIPVEHVVLSKSEITAFPNRYWFLRRTVRAIFPWADSVVTVSRGVADDLAEITGLPRRSITTIYNPIVGSMPIPDADQRGGVAAAWASAQVRVLNIGALKLQKDQETLLRAFAILRQRVDARLLILGEGDRRPRLETLARELGIDKSVDMPGFVPDPSNYLRSATMFVLSSAWEGFGNVIVEALEAGTPVVSTDCRSGPGEILADGKFGRLTPVGDPQALAAAMAAVLAESPDTQALRRRAQDFSVDRSVDQYLALMLPGHEGASS